MRLVLVLFFLGLASVMVQAGDFGMIASFLAPLDDSRGLTSDGTLLYLSDVPEGGPPVHQRRHFTLTKTGQILGERAFSSWCLSHAGSFFYSTATTVHGYQRYTLDFEFIDNVELPGWNHSPRRHAWDGQFLWMTFPAAGENLLRKIDPIAQSTVATIALPFEPTGITWDGTHLWISDVTAGQIHRVSTAGTIVHTMSSPGPSPQGLAWDSDGLWVADDATDTVYLLGETTATEAWSWTEIKQLFR